MAEPVTRLSNNPSPHTHSVPTQTTDRAPYGLSPGFFTLLYVKLLLRSLRGKTFQCERQRLPKHVI